MKSFLKKVVEYAKQHGVSYAVALAAVIASSSLSEAVVTDGPSMVAAFAPDATVLWAMGGVLLTAGAILYVIRRSRQTAGA